jgi:hypothetical protein
MNAISKEGPILYNMGHFTQRKKYIQELQFLNFKF